MPRHMTPEEADDHWTEYGDGGPPPIEDEDDSSVETVASVGDPGSRPAQARSPGEQGDGGVVGWQPIETAPKDGTAVLGCWTFPDRAPLFGVVSWGAAPYDDTWAGSEEGWLEGESCVCGVTHWMPLPTPPLDDLSGGDEPTSANETLIPPPDAVAIDPWRSTLREVEEALGRGVHPDTILAACGGDTVTVPPAAYVSSERHLSGWKVTLGYSTLAEAQDAHQALAALSAASTNTTAGKGPEQ